MPGLPTISPIKLKRQPFAFNREDWIFELKYDGFRGIAYIEKRHCKLVSRNGITFTRFPQLSNSLASAVNARSAILDGEIVVLDAHGIPRFKDLIAGRGRPIYAVFDLLWLNGVDLRGTPLKERKDQLKSHLLPSPSVLYVDHVEDRGSELFKEVCDLNLEGMVAKKASAGYSAATQWIKIKNPAYSRAAD